VEYIHHKDEEVYFPLILPEYPFYRMFATIEQFRDKDIVPMGNFLNLRSKFMKVNRIISYYHGDKTDEPLDTFFRTNDPLPRRSYVFQPIFERFYDDELYKHQLTGLTYEE
jgi:hypothetical protein